MPHIDLEPGDYSERKPKGWRWRLPWSHKDDPKLPLVMALLLLGALGWTFSVRYELSAEYLFGGAAMWSFGFGWMLRSVFRD